MAINRPTTKADYIQVIKYKLGEPYQQIELHENQFDVVVHQALDFYTKNIFDGTKEQVVVVETIQNTFDYALDATGFPQNIWAVPEIINPDRYGGMIPAPYGYTEGDITFLFNIGRLSSGTTITDASVVFQNLDLFKQTFVPKTMWKYNYNDNILRFTVDPGTRKYGIVCSILMDYEGTSEGRIWGNQWFIDYGTALAKIMWGYSLGPKFTGLNLPGGGQIDAKGLVSEGKEEKKDLEDFALANLSWDASSNSIYYSN